MLLNGGIWAACRLHRTDFMTRSQREPPSSCVKEAFTPEDVCRFRVVSDIDLAPDGSAVVYAVQWIDADADAYFSNLWIVSTITGVAVQLTHGDVVDESPRFSPDGSCIAFLSSRAGEPSQLFSVSVHGGEIRQLTFAATGAGEPVWSPDGKWLAFAASVPPEMPAHAPRVVTRLAYKRDGTGFTLDAPSQIFVVSASGGDESQLTSGTTSASDPCWAPDSQQLAFVRTRSGLCDGHRTDIWVMAASGAQQRQLTSECAQVQHPSWSPDGRSIAFHGCRRDGDSRKQVWLAELSGKERRLTSEDDETAEFPLGRTAPPIWSEDSAELIVISIRASCSKVTRIAAAGGSTRDVISGERQITMLSASASTARLAYLWSDTRLCGRIATASWNGSDERELVNVNEHFAAGRAWPRAVLREFASDSELRNQGVLFLPDGQGPWPLFVDVHGGPHAYVEMGFPYHPYWYVLVSRGWAVLSLNPAGSASYGKKFADRLRGRWGELDLPEQLAAIDELIREGVADGNCLAIGGKSYGGYMAAWAIGKTRRFRAAVCSAPVANLESHFGTSDSGYYVDRHDMQGSLFEARERYRRLSPIASAQLAETPTLILHGEDDQRCPIGQAEELFTALMVAGNAPVELVRYPGGSHGLAETGKPSHRVDYNRRIVDWLQKYCGRT